MYFIVWDAKGKVLYDGGSWPMARAALDQAVRKTDKGSPQIVILPAQNPEP